MYGNLPSQSQLADWEFTVAQHSAVPQGILVIWFYIQSRIQLRVEYIQLLRIKILCDSRFSKSVVVIDVP